MCKKCQSCRGFELRSEFMDNLQQQIAKHFGISSPPTVDDLVVADGLDELEKERASVFFTGKTWEEVFRHLQGLKNEPVFGAAYYLEEWSVLSKEALSYYLRAYLEFLFENLCVSDPDEDFISLLIHELYQVIYIHKGSPFDPDQTLLLKRAAVIVSENAKDQKRFEYAGSHIIENVEQFLAELERH